MKRKESEREKMQKQTNGIVSRMKTVKIHLIFTLFASYGALLFNSFAYLYLNSRILSNKCTTLDRQCHTHSLACLLARWFGISFAASNTQYKTANIDLPKDYGTIASCTMYIVHTMGRTIHLLHKI